MNLTGVQRYVIEVSKHFKCLETIFPIRRLSGIQGHLWEQIVLPTKLKGKILWSPSNTGPLSVANQVVTIHDMAALDHPEWFTNKFANWYHFLLPRLIKKARLILTVSEYSRTRIIEHGRVSGEKVISIPLGVSEEFKRLRTDELFDFRRRYSLTKPYILFLGSLDPRKNIGGMMQAWTNVHECYSDIELVIVGGRGKVFSNLDLGSIPDGIRFLGRVPDCDLPSLYGAALLFVFPSFYEGFGLPPLEAMACGCPTLMSDSTSLPEVGGDAVVYCNPFSIEDISGKLIQLVGDSSLRESLSVKGRSRAANFCWEKCALETSEAIAQHFI